MVEYPIVSGSIPPPTATITSLSQVDIYTDVATDSTGNIYVAAPDHFDETKGSVLVFAPNANGMVAPLRTIAVANPAYVAVDGAGSIYVACLGTLQATTILEFAAGADGNAKPIRTITVPTQADDAEALAVDGSGNIVYAYAPAPINGSDVILVYSPDQSGTATPARTISGTESLLTRISDLALDASGNIYAVVQTEEGLAPTVLTFSGGTNGSAVPINSISGPATMLGEPDGIAVDAANNIYVSGGTGLLRFPPTSTGNASPTVVEDLFDANRFAVH